MDEKIATEPTKQNAGLSIGCIVGLILGGMMVVGLLVLLALGGMTAWFFHRTQSGAYSDAAKTQINMFEQQLELYRLHVGSYPTNEQGLQALHEPPSDLDNPQKWRGPYSTGEVPLDPWDNEFRYEATSEDGFRIWSSGRDGLEGTDDDIESSARR